MSYKDNPKATPSAMAPDGDGGDVKVGPPGISSDLSKETIVKLGDYLSTQTRQNAYPITTDGTTGELDAQYQTYTAGTEPHTPYNDNGQDSFVGQSLPDAQSYFDNISQGASGQRKAASLGDLSSLVNKSGRASEKGMKGHEVLSQVKGDKLGGFHGSRPRRALNPQRQWPNPDEPVVKITSETLKQNRWSPGPKSPYIGNYDGQKYYSKQAYSIQNGFGEYRPQAQAPTFNELAKIGSSAQLVATGYEPNAADPTNTNTFLAIMQGVQQQTISAYIKDVKNLEAREIYNHLVDKDKQLNKGLSSFDLDQQGRTARGAGLFSNGGMTKEEDRYSKSNGQLNSYLEPFGGPLPTGMLANAAIAIIAASVIGAGIVSTLSLLLKMKMTKTLNIGGSSIQPAGRRFGSLDYGDTSVGTKILNFLGLPHYLRSLDINPPELPNINLLRVFKLGATQWAKNVGDSPGYFLSVLRQVIRDFRQIDEAWNSVDFSNPIGMAEAIFIIMEAFATSAAFRWTVSMIQLGDQLVISGNLADNSATWGLSGIAGVNPSVDIDDDPLTLMNVHIKSRERPGSKTLAWRFGSLPSMYLLPTSLQLRAGSGAPLTSQAAGLEPEGKLPYGNDTFIGVGIQDERTAPWKKFKSMRGGRIPQAAVESLENSLNALYMPFYFQDLRTNEILAFHAFVENISDSFTPEWNGVHGFGRMDDVQIYKRTKRSIGLSFVLVSTNKQDFDEMWYAINRFVAMTYPQWSRGNQKTFITQTEEGPVQKKFIEPFSQIPTASPVVRMRLGELFKSNFSMSNLQGKFGYGTDSFDVSPSTAEENENVLTQEQEEWRSQAGRECVARSVNVSSLVSPASAEIAGLMAANAMIKSGFGDLVNNASFYNPGEAIFYNNHGGVRQMVARNRLGKWAVYSSMVIESQAVRVAGYETVPGIRVETEEDPNVPGKVTASYKRKRGRRGSNRAGNVIVYYILTPATGDNANKVFFRAPSAPGIVTIDSRAWTEARYNELEADNSLPNPFGASLLGSQTLENQATAVSEFFDKNNNPIVRSFGQAGGQGLAGVINSLEMDWNMGGNTTWETDGEPNRAPKMCKMTITFQPIHDIPMGLDADGAMTAATYPVGDMVSSLFGGPTTEARTIRDYFEDMRERKANQRAQTQRDAANSAADGQREHTAAVRRSEL